MNNTENKYKMALEIVQPCFVSMLKELDGREMCDTEAISFLNLQELVERATPKKLVATKHTRRCPACSRYQFKSIETLNGMKEKGHFKGVNEFATIEDILAKCEVVG